jgi:hypothetical protein
MTFKSAKLTDYILTKYNLPKKNILRSSEVVINLQGVQGLNSLKNLMFERNFTAKEIATMILNEDNPKTMDYYFMKLLKVKVSDVNIAHTGALTGSVKSFAYRITESFGVLSRNLNRASLSEKGQIYFVMDIHDNQIFPTSRSFRICSRKLCPIPIVNPNAGQKKQVVYSSGYTTSYLEPPDLTIPKHLILYCRNAWERKGEVKPSRAKVNNVVATSTAKGGEVIDATAEAVSVI